MSGSITRRRLLSSAACAALLSLAAGACSTSPPLRRHRMRLDAEGGRATATSTPRDGDVWELDPRIDLPPYLDRDALLLDRGTAGVEALPQDRWAEPLRDAVPRLLLHDLQGLRGASRVWPAPAPAGVPVRKRLQVELLAFGADAAQRTLRIAARWSLAEKAGASAPALGRFDERIALADLDAGSIVLAHREAIARLAAAIVAAAPG